MFSALNGVFAQDCLAAPQKNVTAKTISPRAMR